MRVMKVAGDGWKIQMHIHKDGDCVTLEGDARYPDGATAIEYGERLHDALDITLGLRDHVPVEVDN